LWLRQAIGLLDHRGRHVVNGLKYGRRLAFDAGLSGTLQLRNAG
jgi:hypothetical protein